MLQVAALMTAAIRTAPKACGVDTLETIILDGDSELAKILTGADN